MNHRRWLVLLLKLVSNSRLVASLFVTPESTVFITRDAPHPCLTSSTWISCASLPPSWSTIVQMEHSHFLWSCVCEVWKFTCFWRVKKRLSVNVGMLTQGLQLVGKSLPQRVNCPVQFQAGDHFSSPNLLETYCRTYCFKMLCWLWREAAGYREWCFFSCSLRYLQSSASPHVYVAQLQSVCQIQVHVQNKLISGLVLSAKPVLKEQPSCARHYICSRLCQHMTKDCLGSLFNRLHCCS